MTCVSTKIRYVKGVKTRVLKLPRVTFSLPVSLHLNDNYSLMGSGNDKLFVGGDNRLDSLSVHMHHLQ
jgi:hypothetical protein